MARAWYEETHEEDVAAPCVGCGGTRVTARDRTPVHHVTASPRWHVVTTCHGCGLEEEFTA